MRAKLHGSRKLGPSIDPLPPTHGVYQLDVVRERRRPGIVSELGLHASVLLRYSVRITHILLVAITAVLSSCGSLEASPGPTTPIAEPSDATAAANTPLVPDARFERAAREICFEAVGVLDRQLPLVLQDRRRDDMAYLIFGDGTVAVECMLQIGRDGAFHDQGVVASTPATGEAQIAITRVSNLEPDGRLLTGLVKAPISSLWITRTGGDRVSASVRDGQFAAWWLTGGPPTAIFGTDSKGVEVKRITDPSLLRGG